MSLRALLFDLDDTLVPERPAIEAGFAAVAEARVGRRYSRAHHGAVGGRSRRVAGRGAVRVPGPGPFQPQRGPARRPDGDRARRADAMRAFLPGAARPRVRRRAARRTPRSASAELVDVWRAARMAALTRYPETLEVLEHWSARMPLALVTNGASRLQRAKLTATGHRRLLRRSSSPRRTSASASPIRRRSRRRSSAGSGRRRGRDGRQRPGPRRRRRARGRGSGRSGSTAGIPALTAWRRSRAWTSSSRSCGRTRPLAAAAFLAEPVLALRRAGQLLAVVLLDERLGQRVRLVVGTLVHRRLHQVGAGAVELAGRGRC